MWCLFFSALGYFVVSASFSLLVLLISRVMLGTHYYTTNNFSYGIFCMFVFCIVFWVCVSAATFVVPMFSCESVCVFDIYITVKNIRDCLQVSSNALKNNVETIWLILQKNRNGHKYLVLSTLLQVLGSSLAQQSVDTLLNTHEGFTCARPYARVSSF